MPRLQFLVRFVFETPEVVARLEKSYVCFSAVSPSVSLSLSGAAYIHLYRRASGACEWPN